jgi:hypothetical protein
MAAAAKGTKCAVIGFTDSKHYAADPYPNQTFHFDADQDPDAIFHFDVDLHPDPASYQSDANLQPLVYRPSTSPMCESTAQQANTAPF